MSITASCGNCGKTYQAPDRMAGKTVRCKACGEVFRVDPPTDFDPGLDISAHSAIDIDALEKSFSDADATGAGATAGSIAGKRLQPMPHRPRPQPHQREADGLQADDEVGSFGGGGAMRSNFRYRFPGARQVDQFLPWALVLLTLFVVIHASFRTDETFGTDPTPVYPSAVIATSRAAILIGLYLIIVWPASHLALSMASRRLRFAMPRAPLWRSLAGFSPVLMLGAGLFIVSGGDPAALTMGVVVGIALAVGAIALLFRVFPNELPIVGGYAVSGAAVGSGFVICLMIAANLVALTIARTQPPAQQGRFSPIAIGMHWTDVPAEAPIERIAHRDATPSPSPTIAVPIDTTPAAPTTPTTLPNGELKLDSIPLPPVAAGQRSLLRAIELAPVKPGFATVVVPPVTSDAIGVVRADGGGRVETWDRSTWLRPTTEVGRDFDINGGALFVSPMGKRVVRLVSNPTDRIEELPLGNMAVLSPTRVGVAPNTPQGDRRIAGLLDEADVLCTLQVGSNLALERYAIDRGVTTEPPTPLRAGGQLIKIDARPETVMRLTADGKSVIVAGRDRSDDDAGQPRVFRYELAKLDQPSTACEIELNRQAQVIPTSLAVDAPGQHVALLMSTGGELNLTMWELTSPQAVLNQPRSAVLDRKIGLQSSLKPTGWDDAFDPMLWLDDHTLLVYGRTLLDAQSGRTIGETGINNVVGMLPRTDAQGRVVLIQMRDNARTLIRVTFDSSAIDAARK